MCVQTANMPWEREATKEDAKILQTFFKGVDLEGFLKVMQEDGCVPLPTDLSLIGAVLTMKVNEYNLPYLPFTALEFSTKSCVKIPEMENIVDWMENTALGSFMWEKANKFAELNYGRKFYFSMDCGCEAPLVSQFSDGTVRNFNIFLNKQAKDLYGKTNVVYSDSISNTNMSEYQRSIWKLIRQSLEALPKESYIINTVKHEEGVLR
jgi:L-rhamnose mutarotase